MQPARHICPLNIYQVWLVRQEPLQLKQKGRKKTKYANFNLAHTFTPVAIETSGVFGPESLSFLKDLGGRLAWVTGEEKSRTYLIQRLAMAVQ